MGGPKWGKPASSRTAGRALRFLVIAAASVVVASCVPDGRPPAPVNLIHGPLGRFLASSNDLGPANGHPVQLTVALRDSARPRSLIDWAQSRRLSVRWRPGDNYAYVRGGPDDLSRAFGVSVHDYRSGGGQVFYASRQQPEIPAPLRAEVVELGRILSYNPIHLVKPPMIPRDVPHLMLTPPQVRTTYNADTLGTTGKGQTVVFFESDAFQQSDLDKFSAFFHLPPFTPTVKGPMPADDIGETSMDLQVVHAIAPDAQQVIYFQPPDRQNYADLAQSLEQADREHPGAIWSLSFGMGCDTIDHEADLRPVRSAFAAAAARGTSIFISSGDTGGYECKGFGKPGKPDSSTPPVDDEIGLSTLASVPEATDTGGTTLSTDEHGAWANEQGWADYAATQGTGGGVSTLYSRPDWQSGVSVPSDPVFAQRSIPDPSKQRLTPDVSAAADPLTGVAIFHDCKPGNCDPSGGGGTSQAAPIWAALTTLMNQYLTEHGGHPIGNPGKPLNYLLYQVAASGTRPAFHDVTLGGNAVFQSGPGFDLATGLGTPNTENLVNDILDIQKAGGDQ